MKLLQVTIGASATRVSSTSIFCRQVIFQNNAGNACRVGDSTVSATKGVALAAAGATPGGSLNLGPGPGLEIDLKEFYIAGTQTDKIDVLYL